ncbi:uncharacterized protein PSANT_00414 [Moesziomyces antarcticus]|uniref:Uncharacterized protein n=1 Tax=Pseudozyma antarctica TaxID=84753 RepID=A0A5C3FGV4_PSEA2|nr:uncharacterized protein PSANT_00414 [Moesziomyces antarcticus]
MMRRNLAPFLVPGCRRSERSQQPDPDSVQSEVEAKPKLVWTKRSYNTDDAEDPWTLVTPFLDHLRRLPSALMPLALDIFRTRLGRWLRQLSRKLKTAKKGQRQTDSSEPQRPGSTLLARHCGASIVH